MPPPVFFCSIEAKNSRQQQELEKILFKLTKEDPSITAREDENSGQFLISGLGELHLEILRDRVELEYGISADLGPMRVAYRESISAPVIEDEIVLEKIINKESMYAKVKLRIEQSHDLEDSLEKAREILEAPERDHTFTLDEQTSDMGRNF